MLQGRTIQAPSYTVPSPAPWPARAVQVTTLGTRRTGRQKRFLLWLDAYWQGKSQGNNATGLGWKSRASVPFTEVTSSAFCEVLSQPCCSHTSREDQPHKSPHSISSPSATVWGREQVVCFIHTWKHGLLGILTGTQMGRGQPSGQEHGSRKLGIRVQISPL